jgi:dihydroxy-acid dehydratase
MLNLHEELGEQSRAPDAATGDHVPAGQTAWQELHRSTVGQMEGGAVIEPAAETVAQTMGITLVSH